MLADIKALLADPAFRDCDPPPVVDYVTFFDGNTDEESLAPNQWGYGRPTMAELYARFAQIAQRPDALLTAAHLVLGPAGLEGGDDLGMGSTHSQSSLAGPGSAQRPTPILTGCVNRPQPGGKRAGSAG